MKYLQKYKIFESVSDDAYEKSPEDILREISLDLSDEGLYIDFPNDNKFYEFLYVS